MRRVVSRSATPSADVSNARNAPSGDHSGSCSVAGVSVSVPITGPVRGDHEEIPLHAVDARAVV